MIARVDRRLIKNAVEQDNATCDECGAVSEEAVVVMGEWAVKQDPWDIQRLRFCLPCLKRAVAEAEAAVAKDKA